jgi:YD repeat-containing protein
VACVGGELVSLDATTGEVVRALRLERDLRDVIVDGDRLLVTRFRSGELLALDAAGHEVQRVAQSPLQALSFDGELAPAVAWRAAALPGGGAAIVHQRAALADVPITPGGYSALGHCGGSIVEGTVSLAPPSEAADPPLARPAAAVALPGAILPVDIAVSADGEVAVASAGTDHVMRAHVESIEGARPDECGAIYEAIDVVGEPVAVAYDASGRLVAQTREPPTIQVIGGPRLALPGASVADTGHDMFHKNPNGGLLACASCHPEGGDDGRVWSFDGVGPRRTQNLRGSVMSTAPFHWNGDLHGLDALMSEVFVSRMSGKPQGPRRVRAFGEWLDTIPLVPVSPPDDEAAVARGRALFEDAAVGCATCHGGAALTNAATVDVGTGGAFQVPSLRGLAARAPYMHDGSAESLLDRFGPAGGGDTHGHTSHLDGAALRDLVAYLETL